MIEAMPFIFGGSAFIASDEQAREVVRVEKEEGAVGLKCYFTLPWSLHHAVARAAVQQGLPVRAHACAREEAIREFSSATRGWNTCFPSMITTTIS